MDTKPEKPAPQNAEDQDIDVQVGTGGKSDPSRGLKVTPPGDAARPRPQSATSADEQVETDPTVKSGRLGGEVTPRDDA